MATVASQRWDPERVRREHPVADLITRSGVELRPAGRALVGRCPFHADGGRPNLYVYPESQRWWCYRCGIGGDVIDYMRRRENLTFAEACQRLSGAASLPSRAPEAHSQKRERRWDRLTLEEQVVMNIASTVYQHCLWRAPSMLTYLRERGIPDRVIRECALGYADGHSLEAYLRRRSGLRTAQELGLLRKPGARDGARPLSEHLAGRVVVPEIRGGQCIWFIGRAMQDNSDRPKYLALGGERPVLGYERAAGQCQVFLCEGVFDYLAAVSWKLPAFSPCGTHLPAERLGFLARADVIYGVLDGDAAGSEAAQRFAQIMGKRWRALPLPDGCDLNDLARRPDGRETFFRLLADARRLAPRDARHDR